MSVDEARREWRRSALGITPLTIRQRVGSKSIRKRDSVLRGIQQNNIEVPRMSAGGSAQQVQAPPRICSVCVKSRASYTCPRCHVGYCSSACYKTHGSGCTEAFYRAHVEKETRIRDDEAAPGAKHDRRTAMLELLRKMRRTWSASRNPWGDPDPTVDSGSAGETVPLEHEDVRIDCCEENTDTNASEEEQALRDRFQQLALELERIESPSSAFTNGYGDGNRAVESEDTGTATTSSQISTCAARAPMGDGRDLLNMLTEKERRKFMREVVSGRLGTLIAPWKPWWMGSKIGRSKMPARSDPTPTSPPKTTSSEASSFASPPTLPPSPEELLPCDGSDIATAKHLKTDASGDHVRSSTAVSNDESSCARHTLVALVNMTNRSPDFSTLSAHPPSPTLPALAADVAFAYAFTARLYNGCWCTDPVGGSQALVQASPVLQDGATPSTVGGALSACAERAVRGEGLTHAREYVSSLKKDVLIMCEDPGKLACAFQDAWSMLEAAGRTLAPFNASSATGRRHVSVSKSQRRAAKELGRVEKRVGYFLLWARSHGAAAGPSMAADISEVLFESSVCKSNFSVTAGDEGVNAENIRLSKRSEEMGSGSRSIGGSIVGGSGAAECRNLSGGDSRCRSGSGRRRLIEEL